MKLYYILKFGVVIFLSGRWKLVDKECVSDI